MKKRTLAMIIGVSAVSGGIMLAGKVYTPVKANSSGVSITSTMHNNNQLQLSLDEYAEDTDTLISDLTQSGQVTESQARVIVAFEQKILEIAKEQRNVNADKQKLQQHVHELQADLLRFIHGENLSEVVEVKTV